MLLFCKLNTEMANNGIVTLEQFIVDQQHLHKEATGSLSRIFRALELASKLVNRDVRKAGLADILGQFGVSNVHGEDQQKLDVIANNTFINTLAKCGEICCIASEENNDLCMLEATSGAPYIVCIDPLDGSSNIDVNASIGTIFGIYKRISNGAIPQVEDCLQPGLKQVAAGYFIYGSSTMLVYTTGSGVNGFTLDDSIQEYCLSHPDMKIPANGKIYSLNEGNYVEFPEGVKNYIDWCKEKDKDTARPYSARYIGSMIADFHRNLIKGGIFIYPPTEKTPDGKLRLLYECNPMSFIMEQAGGLASTGKQRVMEIIPTELHQRVPIFIGSKNMVEKALAMLNAEVAVN